MRLCTCSQIGLLAHLILSTELMHSTVISLFLALIPETSGCACHLLLLPHGLEHGL